MVTTSAFLQETVLFIRDDLDSNVTDPISASRTSRERFVMTSYPLRETKYPIITVKLTGASDVKRLGIGSELHHIKIPVEIRIWARNEKERDSLTQEVYNRFRTNQFSGAGTSSNENLFDFEVVSSVSIDEDQDSIAGESLIKSQILAVEYKFILGV